MKEVYPNKHTICLYTYGASQGNPGPGGYGLILQYGSHKKELSQGFRLTTNNRMELLAVIVGLEAIKTKNIPVKVFSDSTNVVNSVKKGWLWTWEKNCFKKKANVDLWKRFLPLYHRHHPDFIWIKGHVGHIENERCDQLAVLASQQPPLQTDMAYEVDENDSPSRDH